MPNNSKMVHLDSMTKQIFKPFIRKKEIAVSKINYSATHVSIVEWQLLICTWSLDLITKAITGTDGNISGNKLCTTSGNFRRYVLNISMLSIIDNCISNAK